MCSQADELQQTVVLLTCMCHACQPLRMGLLLSATVRIPHSIDSLTCIP
jgi:hypothetical protein